MEVQEYIEKKVEIQTDILELIDNEEDVNGNLQKIFDHLDSQHIFEDKNEFISFIHLLHKISKNHNRTANFFFKIEQIIMHIKEHFHNFFTNSEIFNFFKADKRILLFLIEQKIIAIDQSIVDIMKNQKYQKLNYLSYFINEIESFLDEKTKEEIKELLYDIDSFEEKRQVGENESYICQLIRNDSIEDFISFINRNNIGLSSTINNSIFETNSFLLKNQATLIEYAAFFGSIQIFNFLNMNKIELKPSLWLFVIHGRNPELIHFLEDNHIKPNDQSFSECLNESIKCHHLEISDYIRNNLYQNLNEKEYIIFSKSYKYFNYTCFPKDVKNEFVFYDLCQYNYLNLVELLMNTTNLDLNMKVVFLIK